MNKSVATLVAVKKIKTASLILQNPEGFSGYVTLEVVSSYVGADDRIVLNNATMQLTFLDSCAEIISMPQDTSAWVKIKGMRDEVLLTW